MNMELLDNIKIFLKDSIKTKNIYNKKILTFLNNNCETFGKCGIYIRLIIIDDSNIKKFIDMGIKNTPALLYNSEEVVIGVENIINYIIDKCENKENLDHPKMEQHNKNIPNKQPSNSNSLQHGDDGKDNLRDYLLAEALSEDSMEEPVDLNKVKNYEDKYSKNRDKLVSINKNTNKSVITNAKNNSSGFLGSISNSTEEVAKMIVSNTELTPNTKKISNYMSDDPDLKNFWENLETTD